MNFRRDCEPSLLSWHPHNRILVVGWEDGKISLWNDNEKKAKEPSQVHEAKIRFLKWSDAGDRLISGDEKGTVAVWFAEKGNLSLICKYQRDGTPQTQCVFRNTGEKNDNGVFYFGGDKGIVYIADDTGSVRQTLTIGDLSPIGYLFYSPEKDSLVVVSKTSLLYVFKVTHDGKSEQVKKVKIYFFKRICSNFFQAEIFFFYGEFV